MHTARELSDGELEASSSTRRAAVDVVSEIVPGSAAAALDARLRVGDLLCSVDGAVVFTSHGAPSRARRRLVLGRHTAHPSLERGGLGAQPGLRAICERRSSTLSCR